MQWTDHILRKAALIALVTQLCLYFADLYDFRVITDRRELFVRAVQALGATSLILAGAVLLAREADDRPWRVHPRRGAGDPVRVRLATGVRLGGPPRRAA